jgi:pyruvate dehydrogenase E1 component beta subunit
MPVTVRIPSFGASRARAPRESPETYYAHTAGLECGRPVGALDGYTLLRHAIADPDPVVVLEPKARYWAKEDGELSAEGRRSAPAACCATAPT